MKLHTFKMSRRRRSGMRRRPRPTGAVGGGTVEPSAEAKTEFEDIRPLFGTMREKQERTLCSFVHTKRCRGIDVVGVPPYGRRKMFGRVFSTDSPADMAERNMYDERILARHPVFPLGDCSLVSWSPNVIVYNACDLSPDALFAVCGRAPVAPIDADDTAAVRPSRTTVFVPRISEESGKIFGKVNFEVTPSMKLRMSADGVVRMGHYHPWLFAVNAVDTHVDDGTGGTIRVMPVSHAYLHDWIVVTVCQLPSERPPDIGMFDFATMGTGPIQLSAFSTFEQQFIREKFPTARDIVCTGKYLCFTVMDDEVGAPRERIRVPREALSNAVTMAIGKKIDLRTARVLEARVRADVRKSVKDGVPAEAAVTFIVHYATLRAARITTSLGRDMFTVENRNLFAESNAVTQWEFWKDYLNWKWLLAAAIIALMPIIGFLLGATMLSAIILHKSGMKKLKSVWRSRRKVSAAVLSVVEAGGATLYYLTGWFTLPGALLFTAKSLMKILILYQLFANVSSDLMYLPWEQLKASVDMDNRSLVMSCSVPPGGGFLYHESLVDVSDWPVSEHAWIDESDFQPRHLERRVGSEIVLVCFSQRLPLVASTSDENLRKGIYTRCIAAMPEATPGAWRLVSSIMDPLYSKLIRAPHGVVLDEPDGMVGNKMRHIHAVPTVEEWLCRYPPVKRKAIEEELKRQVEEGYELRRFCYDAFVKREKIVKIKPGEMEVIRPRIIQGISTAMKAAGGRWFLSYSNALKDLFFIGSKIWYSSGATAEDLNWWINDAVIGMGGVGNCTFLFSDFSKYDMTQGVDASEREAAHYRRIGILEEPWGATYIQAKLHSRCYGRGIKYGRHGTRKSGDLDTSSGNTKMTVDVVVSWLEHSGLKDYRVVSLGDDNLVVCNATEFAEHFSPEEAIASLKAWAEALGFKLKVGCSDDIMDAEYLSARFYPVGDRYVYGYKPGRVMSKVGMMLAGHRDPEESLGMMKGTLISMLPTASHVPFLRVYVNQLVRYIGVPAIVVEKTKWKVWGSESVEADESTWAAFENYYGLGPEVEEVFSMELKAHLEEFGVPSVMDSEVLALLVDRDFSL